MWWTRSDRLFRRFIRFIVIQWLAHATFSLKLLIAIIGKTSLQKYWSLTSIRDKPNESPYNGFFDLTWSREQTVINAMQHTIANTPLTDYNWKVNFTVIIHILANHSPDRYHNSFKLLRSLQYAWLFPATFVNINNKNRSTRTTGVLSLWKFNMTSWSISSPAVRFR